MKKTNKEVLDFLGLKIGDKIKVKGFTNPFVIREDSGKIFAEPKNCLSSIGTLTDVLLNNEYEVITQCKGCPLVKCLYEEVQECEK